MTIEHNYLTTGEDEFLTIGEDAFLTLGFTGDEGQERSWTGTFTLNWTDTTFTITGVGQTPPD
jgi:hypothetical protein